VTANKPQGGPQAAPLPPQRLFPCWRNILFLAFGHAMGALAVVYLSVVAFSWWTIGLAALWLLLCGVAITAGYHRLFAHPTYEAAWPVRLFYLCFGAASAQNTALKWAADHREHHARTDFVEDPYNARRGFWWSHIGWVLFDTDVPTAYRRVPDLVADPLVRFQHRAYYPLVIGFGMVLPAGLGLLWGDPLGALLCAGFLRLVFQWHQTFCVNSVAHLIGRQPYSQASTARDSWVTAVLTLGEGYHNFHHRFPNDYRNGIRWFHFDPTKWLIWTLSKVGLARELRRMPQEAIVRAAARAGE
jgi:stearoyl-CoA desaturase (delta-9 desaturase)